MQLTDATRRLENARARAEARVQELSWAFDAVVESSADSNLDDEHDPEGATVGFERAQISKLLDDARAQLVELDAAADRLADGGYGVCATCGRPIAPERLEAQPASRLCFDCAASGSRPRARA